MLSNFWFRLELSSDHSRVGWSFFVFVKEETSDNFAKHPIYSRKVRDVDWSSAYVDTAARKYVGLLELTLNASRHTDPLSGWSDGFKQPTSHALGISPDYIILSKALGGGVAKISALLVKRQRYQQSFDLLHSSTFADDEFSCAIALKTLELLDSSTLQRCRSQGDYLLQRLHALARQFPTVIAEVRGAGLFIGIELQRPTMTSGFLLNFPVGVLYGA